MSERWRRGGLWQGTGAAQCTHFHKCPAASQKAVSRRLCHLQCLRLFTLVALAAHVMNNEMQRKYLQSVKRLIKFEQTRRVDVAPSKKVL